MPDVYGEVATALDEHLDSPHPYLDVNQIWTGDNDFQGTTTIDSLVISALTYDDIVSHTLFLDNDTAGSVVLRVEGAATQTGHLQDWQSNGGTVLAYVNDAGRLVSAVTGLALSMGSTSDVGFDHASLASALFWDASDGRLTVTSAAAAVIPLVVKAHASQSGDLQQWQTSAGTKRAYIDSAGSFIYSGSAASAIGFEILVSGDAEPRFSIAADGDLAWGDGTNAADVGLFRVSGTVLGSDANVRAQNGAGAQVTIGDVGPAGQAAVQLGSDTSIYRSGADTLKTDDTFEFSSLSITNQTMTVSNGTGYIELIEQNVDPTAGASGSVRFFARDNGAGKTQICVRFPTGSVQVIAEEV